MKKRIILLAMLIMPMSVNASDYPTEAIVRNVIDCMTELGGLNDPNLYTCTCRADYTMSHMTFAEYDDATFFDRNKQMAGKRGAMVRDNERGKAHSEMYEKVLSEAEKNCPVVKHIEPVKNKAPEKTE